MKFFSIFFFFGGHFCPACWIIRVPNLDPDPHPLTHLNPVQIRIRNTANFREVMDLNTKQPMGIYASCAA
jgi:hypothetical protein